MATEAKNNKKLIFGIVGAVAIIAIIAVVVIVIIKNQKPALGDNYFKSDDTKLVITIDGDSSAAGGAVKQHQVYNYSGDKITGFKTYAEFASNDDAKKAYDKYMESNQDITDTFTSVELDGKYIVMTAKEEQFKELTTSAIKSYIEIYESMKNSTNSSNNE